ncbi:CD2-associated protein-like isoform X2 [Phymastichus coffea]|uniref:CD2-associated protein-like isoform X2 n=1 Tax=Phymastichus coffea TaxID=108790 RepID=UPI00273C0230|nr:CD2-associated protein-like isoform X2 [Phymastichus coffea]
MEAVVEYNYEAQEPDELSIRKGDIIKDIKTSNGGWWEGTLRDKRGMFPDNFVKVLDPSGSTRNKNDEVTLRNNAGRKICRVLFSYEPCNDDELKLVVDDNIEYLGEVEEGWWRGRIKGRTGVFPSNFVAPPVPEEAERQHKEKKEFCKVLFPYEAANDDELTIVEGDIITLLSKDAPDKGWWKGELKGQIGLFPDNFVELITLRNNDHQDGQVNNHATKSSLTKNQVVKKKETAVIRKSLDIRNNTRIDNTVKKITMSSSATSLSANTGDKKPTNALISSFKRFMSDSGNSAINNNGNGNAGTALGEELDEVERGEGAPLSHLTASRAKAPRRRLPSTHALKQQNSTGGSSPTNNNMVTLKEDNMTNGSSELLEAPAKDDENDGNLMSKSKQKPPWMEELKLNQMERHRKGCLHLCTIQKFHQNQAQT